MKRVSGYQTTDGKIFTALQKNEAREHQKALNIMNGLVAIGDRIDDDFGLDRDDRDNNVIYTGTAFATFVMRHAADIKLALEGKELPAVNTVEVQE